MQIFITGTDTNVGKTIISSWICIHRGYSYFKPIQTGSILGTDSNEIDRLVGNIKVYKENFVFKEPLSPHLSALLERSSIDVNTINLPKKSNLIVEGAGGVLTPINEHTFMVDLIKRFDIPVILVARSILGTINHTLLSLEALRTRNIKVLGVILNGPYNQGNLQAIEFYGKVSVLASMPELKDVETESLKSIALSNQLKNILKAYEFK